MKRPRPHIPLSVRVQVAARQALSAGRCPRENMHGWPFASQLREYLFVLFGEEKVALDHNPALILRAFNEKTGLYTPDANDPDHLVYRTYVDHHLKTNVRGDGAHRSDTSERVHWRKVAKNKLKRAAGKKSGRFASAKIPSRPFPKGRKFNKS